MEGGNTGNAGAISSEFRYPVKMSSAESGHYTVVYLLNGISYRCQFIAWQVFLLDSRFHGNDIKEVERMIKKLNPGSVLLLLFTLLLTACDKGEDSVTEEIIRPVRYTRASLNDGMTERVFSGTSKAEVESSLSFKVSGTLLTRSVNVGDQLKAGQVIASLDPAEFNISKHEAEASLANALAEMRRAKHNYERVKTLYENDNTSKHDLDSARAAAESAAAHVESVGQKLRSAKLQLSYTKLHSPGLCAVANTYMKENENVSAGTAIVKVNCGDCPEVKISVPGSFISQIVSGSEVEVSFDAFSDQHFKAIVTEVGVSSAGTSTAFPVTVALQEGCDQIRAGMAADVGFEFSTGGGDATIMVPEVAVGEDRKGRYVFVLQQDQDLNWITQRRSVELGEFSQDGLVISSGLKEGELVVTAGVRRIIDGQKVKLLSDMEK
jgi:membrane fusion protein, multidrug efflux system